MKLTIDRIEGGTALCETPEREIWEIPVSLFLQRPREGDVIEYANGAARVLEEETRDRRERLSRRMDSLFRPK